MADKRDTRGAPIRVGDDHGDDESTVLDVPRDAVREALKARAATEGGAGARAVQGGVGARAAEGGAGGDGAPPPRPPPPSVADDDPDKTEMIERPDLSDLEPARAPRGVVPLGEDAAKLIGRTTRADRDPPKTETFTAVLSDEAETVMMTRPSGPEVRNLDDLSLPAIGSDLSDDKTLSRPKIERMTFRPEPPRDAAALEAAEANTKERLAPSGERPKAPAPRPLPAPGAPLPAAAPSRPAPDPSVGEASPAAGVLVVEAPPGAAVFVDGKERGSGRVEVRDLDRFARVAVRVHHSGYKPWNRLLSLDGKDELRVTPTLEPR